MTAQGEPAIRISFFSESTSVPFTDIPLTPVHPGIQIGTQFEPRHDRRVRLLPTISMGYLFHRKLFQGLYLRGELNVDVALDFGLNLKTGLSLGYLRTYAVQQEFRRIDGRLVPAKDRGNSRVMPALSLGMGWRLRPNEIRSTEIFALYETWLEYPYSPGFIPLMSHTNLHLGAKLYPFGK